MKIAPLVLFCLASVPLASGCSTRGLILEISGDMEVEFLKVVVMTPASGAAATPTLHSTVASPPAVVVGHSLSKPLRYLLQRGRLTDDVVSVTVFACAGDKVVAVTAGCDMAFGNKQVNSYMLDLDSASECKPLENVHAHCNVPLGGDAGPPNDASPDANTVTGTNLANIETSSQVEASSPQNSEMFGQSVAVAGGFMASGVPGQDSEKGAVRLFRADNMGGWAFHSYLTVATASGGDRFGDSVAMSGDLLVVGAPFDEAQSGPAQSGAAYVFRFDPAAGTMGQWKQEAILVASNADGADRFGASVAISGNNIVVGAPLEDGSAKKVGGNGDSNSNLESGAAYVFSVDPVSGTLTQTAYLKASNTRAGHQFGTMVAISKNLIAIGAPFEKSATNGVVDGRPLNIDATEVGAVYVYRFGLAWQWEEMLKPFSYDDNGLFGQSVAVLSDIPGVGDLIAVGWKEDRNEFSGPGDADSCAPSVGLMMDDIGAVQTFVNDGTGSGSASGWAVEACLKANEARETYGLGGGGVALAYLDGKAVLVAGSLGDTDSDSGVNPERTGQELYPPPGGVSVFTRAATGWDSRVWHLKGFAPAEPKAEDKFSQSVAVGVDGIVVGAPNRNDAAGAAYVFKWAL